MPSADLPTQIVFAIIIAIVVMIAGYFIARRLKGRVILVFDKPHYHLGETIVGRAEVTGRRTIDYEQIVLTLRCEEKTETRVAKGETEYHTTTLYEVSKRLAETGRLLPRRALSLGFEIPLPESRDTQNSALQVDLSDYVPDGMARVLKPMVKNRKDSVVVWSVAVEVEAKGVDFGACETITVDTQA